ncbi:hypothetical protein HWV62_40790 [Athelia sp. TMB]|nr:hypothetical protein HWV62_40790 [Athelia sp. TMB]
MPNTAQAPVLDPRKRPKAKPEPVSPVVDCVPSTSYLKSLSSPGHQFNPQTPQRHPRFWEASGDVILQIQSTLFRVHGTTLAKHSRLFASAGKGKGDLDGSTLHVLALVTASDFEVLLDALENIVQYHTQRPPFQYVAALLRVSTILQFHSYRQFAIHMLEEAWPSSLAQFSVAIPWPEHAAAAVALARDCSVPQILKRAIYALLMTPGFSNTTDIEMLSAPELLVLCRAREYLSKAWIMAAIVPDSNPCPAALPPPISPTVPRNPHLKQLPASVPTRGCIGVQTHQLLTPVGLANFVHNPISGLVAVAAVVVTLKEQGILCDVCHDRKWHELMSRREEIWVELDEVLGLAP